MSELAAMHKEIEGLFSLSLDHIHADILHRFIDEQQAKIDAPASPLMWVSVEDRLPDDGPVLIWTEGKSKTVSFHAGGGNYNGDKRWVPLGARLKDWGITHWMPLPDPPQESSDE